MLLGIVIVTVLLIVSGAIAYIGDNLGRKIGKKKVTVFGLRPKHTSILITIVTGVLITSMTLGVILALSRSARTAFFGLEKLRDEYGRTKEELRAKNSELEAQKKRVAQSAVEYSKLQSKLDREQADYRALQEKRAQDQTKLDALADEIKAKTTKLDEVNRSLDSMKASVAGMTKEIKTLEVQRTGLTRERDELVKKKDALQRELSDMATQMGEIQKDALHGDILYQKRQPLARFIVMPGIGRKELDGNLKESIDVMLDAAKKLGATVGPDADMFHKFQYDNVWEALANSKDGVVVEADSATNVFKGEPFYVELIPHENRLLFKAGTTLVSGIVPAGASEEQVKADLSKLIGEVTSIARERGVLPDMQTWMVGNMPVARYYEAISSLTNLKQPATIDLFTSADTRVADQLHIDFTIR